MKAFVSGDAKSGVTIRIVYPNGSPGTFIEVRADKDWLYFGTGDYERVMVGVEALPQILKALREIQKSRKPTPAKQ